jgi:hypothetical protein
MPGIEDYLSGLWQAIQGQSVPQQPQAANPPSAAVPSQSGGLTGLLSNPLTQAALQGYFSAAGSPRMAGLGGRISAGGLGALSGFNAAEGAQTKSQEQQLAIQKAQAEAAQAAQQQKVFNSLNPQQQQIATYPGLATYEQKAGIAQANKQAVAAFQAGHPGDQNAAAFSAPYGSMTTAVAPGDIESDYQKKLLGPGALKEQQATLAEKQAATKRLNEMAGRPAAGATANWFDPTAKQYYRGAQKKPTDIPASVAMSSKSDQEMKARAAFWQKEYQNARTDAIRTGTKTGYFGGKTLPNEADVDAYARQQADENTLAHFGAIGTSASSAGAASADEPDVGGSGFGSLDDLAGRLGLGGSGGTP